MPPAGADSAAVDLGQAVLNLGEQHARMGNRAEALPLVEEAVNQMRQ